jgi:ligand-binding SRPBCC domain-containing protein
MGFYQFKKTQEINSSIEEVWSFISNPENLKKITPEYMGFDIVSESIPSKMYEGMIIEYRVSPLFGLKTTWVTEITNYKKNKYFVDEQRIGPYKIWHHQHILEPTENGVMMTDIISYQPPYGILGKLANAIIIKKKLKEIFDYRTVVIREIFNS